MKSAAVLYGGWLAAGTLTLVALLAWRLVGARTEAMARAWHELRGPLGAVRLALELAKRSEKLPRQRLHALDQELEKAITVLDGLALASRGGPARRVDEEIDMAAVVRDSVEAWAATAEASGTRISERWSGLERRVRGDRARLAQALGNLLANAIEHGGSEVQVRGRCIASEVRIEVTDSGPGLPAPVAVLARAARRGKGRRGRGLAIASAIVEDHGGRLSAAPSERGARLIISLPVATRSRAVPAPADR